MSVHNMSIRGRGEMAQTRRAFLQTSGLAAAGLWLAGSRAWGGEETERKVRELVPGKDKRLIVLEKSPIVLETPLALLADSRITPLELFFVRNNQDLADANGLEGVELAGWTIEIGGLVNTARTIDASTLAKLEMVEREMVVQCSGNSRALFAKSAKAEGTQWGRGGMGNVVFRGVPVRTVLKYLGLESADGARFVTVEGKDEPKPGKDDFEHSLRVDDVLNKSLLALEMNGKPLAAVHGGPVRLVTPGFFGTMHIKWVKRITFAGSESEKSSHIPRYRVPVEPIAPGSAYEFSYENSRPNWEMNVKSVILTPAPDERVSGNAVRIRGVAFNDGSARIESVLVSVDRGETWRRAKLERPESLYAWTPWAIDVALERGAHEVWSRAVDALGRSQPDDGASRWNPHGYEWNGVEKVPVLVT